ncbi:MAG: PID-CTERM protein-sorting domain-containing protein, partial [Flavobacteriales bacterium]
NSQNMQKVFAAFLTLLFLVTVSVLFAQPGPPDFGPPCGGPLGPPCPIDGGVSLLIAAGLAYGGKKTYDISRTKG